MFFFPPPQLSFTVLHVFILKGHHGLFRAEVLFVAWHASTEVKVHQGLRRTEKGKYLRVYLEMSVHILK